MRERDLFSKQPPWSWVIGDRVDGQLGAPAGCLCPDISTDDDDTTTVTCLETQNPTKARRSTKWRGGVEGARTCNGLTTRPAIYSGMIRKGFLFFPGRWLVVTTAGLLLLGAATQVAEGWVTTPRLHHGSVVVLGEKATTTVETRRGRKRGLTIAYSSAQEQEKVRMFGAKLDAGLAGNRAVSRAEITAVLRGDETDMSPSAKAEIFYAEAVEVMNRGDYERSVELLNKACWMAGTGSRQGGQMQLWLAQSLYAAGRRSQSIRLLAVLEKHPDRDVRTVASELLFILSAPALKLDSSSYVSIDMDRFNDDSVYERRPDGTIGKRPKSKLPEEPEYGSVEWAQAQARFEPAPAALEPAVAVGATLAFVASLLLFRHP